MIVFAFEGIAGTLTSLSFLDYAPV